MKSATMIDRALSILAIVTVLQAAEVLRSDRGAGAAPRDEAIQTKQVLDRDSVPTSIVVATRSIFSLPVLEEDDSHIPAQRVVQIAPPLLTVRAIVGGPPWSALVSGWPGLTPQRVVRTGDLIDSLRIVRIDTAGVEFRWGDSAWKQSLVRRLP